MLLFLKGGSFTVLDFISFLLTGGKVFIYWRDCKV